MKLFARTSSLLLAGSLLGGCAHHKGPVPMPAAPPTAAPVTLGTPDAAFRATKPDALARELHFDAPVPVERKLKNGIRVLVRENHNVPLVVIDVVVGTGINGDSAKKPGLADMTASLLTEGTKSRTQAEISTALDDLAAYLTANATLEATILHLNCLTETLPSALDVMADVVQHPAFRPADVERVRGLQLTDLQQKNGFPGALASDETRKLLYGAQHPWGQPNGGTVAAVTAFKAEDFAKFHATWFHPNNAFVVVSGDISPEAAQQLLEEKLGGWKGKAPAQPKLPALPVLKERHLVVVDRAHQSQSSVWMTTRVFGAGNPDAVPLQVGNNILGGLFSSRLNLNLREDKGYSYGVRSSVNLGKDHGALSASGGIVAEHTVEAAVEYKKEMDHFGTGEVTDTELHQAKEAAIRGLPGALESNDAVTGALSGLVLKGLPLDYYAQLPAKVQAVTSEDVKRVAQKYVKNAPWQTVIVGPVGAKVAALGALGLGTPKLETPDSAEAAPAAKKLEKAK